jgi:hypothetical protein
MTNRLRMVACVATLLTVVGLNTPALRGSMDDPPAKSGVEAKDAFKKLKTLVGTWTGKITDEKEGDAKKEHEDSHPEDAPVTFKLTGAGSALIETQFPGMPHEMVSVYHLDGKDLRMTHYCAAQNQPHLKLDRANSKADDLIFVFDGGTNLDPEKDMHIHGLRIKFEKDGQITSAWEGYVGGKKQGTTTFHMNRKEVDSKNK